MKWYRKAGYQGPIILEAYMRKKKSSKSLSFFNYNKRWFVLDFDKGTLTYAPNKKKEPTQVISFNDILRVECEITKEDLRDATSSKRLKELKRQMIIYTLTKVYYLYFCEDNSNQKSTWACALNFIIKERNNRLDARQNQGSMSKFDQDGSNEASGFQFSPKKTAG